MAQTKQPTNTGALATLVMVFFFWGFIAASNSIFIPFCKTHFNLNQFQSQLIGSAFYGAYFIGSLLLFILSNVAGYDILNKIGYKKGIIYGLWISVAGALLIIPSANANSFPAILGSFFVVALGFSLQQTAAQPFAIILGIHPRDLTGLTSAVALIPSVPRWAPLSSAFSFSDPLAVSTRRLQ